MPDVYGYTKGRCTVCHKDDVDVRHKATIWLIGSEGTDMCWPCERAMLQFLRTRSSEAALERKEEFKRRKEATA